MSREDIARLIPHQGAMCLWEEVIEWDGEHVRLRSHGHRDPMHPLRHGGRLHAVHLCEYGAQAMAVHGGLLAQAAGEPVRPGMLVSLRGVELMIDRIDQLAGALEVEARCLIADATGSQYQFAIQHRGVEIARGRAAVLYR
jgi:predicted hotdog family 3-hydroxylacyl-ACP dehydratase